MFDANMRHLPVGHKSFTHVTSVKEGGLWQRLGLKRGDVVLCTTNKSGDWDNVTEDLKANVTVHLPTGDITVTAWGEDKYYSRMVYEGTLDVQNGNVLTGFVDEDCLNKAVQTMESLDMVYIVGDNPNIKHKSKEKTK